MPSVRIKRTDYDQLEGDSAPSQPSGFPTRMSLAGIFPNSPDSTTQTNRARRATVSSAREVLRTPSPPNVAPRRPRAGSRVADHVMSRASSTMGLRNRRSSSPLIAVTSRRSSSSRRSPVPGMVVMEGSQAEIMMQQLDGEAPGIIDDALSHGDFSDTGEEEHHHDDIVEHLDVIDAQVATVSNLTNAANSILIPPLAFYSRKPVVFLSSPTRQQLMDIAEKGEILGSDKHEDALDRHVEDLLARPSKIRRTLQGLWSFIKTPMGVVVAIYGFLVAFWGAAIVFFLAKFINFHNANTQGFWVEVSSQVVNGLFTVTGVGLIPVRAVDTYRVYKIWSYKRRTRILREKAGLPQLYDVDDLPDPAYDPNYVHVLNDKEQADLHHQQEKFKESQTWYRPHGTETHRAFPINTALLICLFIDGNSFFQVILCGTMWGLNRFQRPAYSTGILIPASFLCGIAAAGLIWRGGQKTKRTKEVEERLRQALAGNINSQECVRALNDDTYNAGAVTTHNDNAEEHHPSEDGKNSYADTQDVDKMTTPSTYRG